MPVVRFRRRQARQRQTGSFVSPREHIQPLLDAGMTLEEVERALIQAANSDSGGNITAAAQRLGMTRAAYAYRLKKHRL